MRHDHQQRQNTRGGRRKDWQEWPILQHGEVTPKCTTKPLIFILSLLFEGEKPLGYQLLISKEEKNIK